MKQKILLIEDETHSRLSIFRYLSEKGHAVSVTGELPLAEEEVLEQHYGAVILAINGVDGKAFPLIKGIRSCDPFLPILVLTGGEEIGIAVDAVRCGADNVLAKPVEWAALGAAVDGLMPSDVVRVPQKSRSREEDGAEARFFAMGFGARSVLDLASQAAAGDETVLITGETGTGKGLMAKWLQQHGKRSGRPFAALNCSGLRGELVRAELFGTLHQTGTGSRRGKRGLLEKAADGTLFLDEIGDLELPVQVQLLAALCPPLALRQPSPDTLCSPYTRLSGPAGTGPASWGEASGVAFRLLCTSNHDLEAMAAAGSFLPELLDLISGTTLRLPPLRERLSELPGIVRRLLEAVGGAQAEISEEAMRLLKGYPWPGNLRELKNTLEQAFILSQGRLLQVEHFRWLKSSYLEKSRPLLTTGEFKNRRIAAVLQRANCEAPPMVSNLGV